MLRFLFLFSVEIHNLKSIAKKEGKKRRNPKIYMVNYVRSDRDGTGVGI